MLIKVGAEKIEVEVEAVEEDAIAEIGIATLPYLIQREDLLMMNWLIYQNNIKVK